MKEEALKLALDALEHMLEDAKQERLTVEYWNECVDAIIAIKQALAAPVQEPDHNDELTIAYMSGLHRGKELAPQRQWVGLTDKEILAEDVLRYYFGLNGGAGPVSKSGRKIVDALEAKLKEKNT